MILAGDIGGTKSRLALVAPQGGPREMVAERDLPSRDYPGLEAVVKDFLQQHPDKVTFSCFGVPGPVIDGRCETPNLPWVVETTTLESVIGKSVVLINDLEAAGYGVETLRPDELFTLCEGTSHPKGNAALIAPGTGLGESILFWNGRRRRPSASEGGHADFAPRTNEEIAFLQWFQEIIPRVSFDRVVCGSGLSRIYQFLKESGVAEEPQWLAKKVEEAEDPAALISETALQGKCNLCERALHMWVSIFGAEAGNLALKALATGGVYVAGGIAPKILPKLRDGTFAAAFRDKGRLSNLMGRIPVQVVLNDKAPLYGSALYALQRDRGEID